MTQTEESVSVVAISGKITGFGAADGEVTVQLLQGNEEIAKGVTTDVTYCLETAAPGACSLVISKENHVTRVYSLTVTDEDVTLDVKLHLIGDITGDGRVNVGDVSKLYAHIRGSTPIDDDYQLLCANVNGGTLNIGDVSALYAHIKGTKKLF